MTREELEAEVAHLRAALAQAEIRADRFGQRQTEQEHRHLTDLTVSRRQTIEANGRTIAAQEREQAAAKTHRRHIADALADLSDSRELVAMLRESQIALAASEARQRAIFENATDIAMIVTDPSGIITDWNPGAQTVLGWTAEEMVGQDAERFFTPEDRESDRIEYEMSGALRNGRATDERWHLRKD
ncbi:PAS domain S-box protein, partial [Sphingomonas sp. RB1R13]